MTRWKKKLYNDKGTPRENGCAFVYECDILYRMKKEMKKIPVPVDEYMEFIRFKKAKLEVRQKVKELFDIVKNWKGKRVR